jgi:hypothetical protein
MRGGCCARSPGEPPGLLVNSQSHGGEVTDPLVQGALSDAREMSQRSVQLASARSPHRATQRRLHRFSVRSARCVSSC